MKLLSFVMAIMLFTMPFLTLAQQSDEAFQAIIDAKADVQSSTHIIWVFGSFLAASVSGCLGGSVVVGASQVYNSSPPAHRLLGKSPAYIMLYTETYQTGMKSSRTMFAMGGCIAGSLVAALIWGPYYQQSFASY